MTPPPGGQGMSQKSNRPPPGLGGGDSAATSTGPMPIGNPRTACKAPPDSPSDRSGWGVGGGGEQSGVGMEGTGWVMSSNSVPILQNRTTPTSVGHWQDRQLSHGGTILLSQELTGVTGNVGIAASWFL